MTAKDRIANFNTKNIIEAILKYTLPIMFAVSVIIMMYLSFIDNLRLPGDWRAVTLFGAAGAILSYNIWLMSYRKQYEEILVEDINNEKYSIHRRYYFARKGWKTKELQIALEQAKKDFKKAWEGDVEDITGRKIDEIRTQGYKKYPHKILIYRVKHNKYPKYGVKYARQLQNVLNVGNATSKTIDIYSAERHFKVKASQKLFTAILLLCTTGSIVVDFLTGNIWTALFKLGVAIVSLVMALVFGSLNGYAGAKKKLGVAEVVSELLEEWKNKPEEVTEVPYKEIQPVKEEPKQLALEDIDLIKDETKIVIPVKPISPDRLFN